MTTPRRFNVGVYEVEALRWEPHKPAARKAMHDWLTQLAVTFTELPSPRNADLRLQLDGAVALPGNWVVHHHGGRTAPMSAHRFTAAHQEIPT
jgi:hypothetical protein